MPIKRPLPILFLSDAPDQHSGLARITRDLASLLSADPTFRVGVLGLQGHGSRKLPFTQYSIQFNSATGDGRWGDLTLPEVWHDFAGGEAGVVFTIWDATRLMWFARPEFLPESKLRSFLESRQFVKWGYFPVDATGPGDRLTAQTRHTLQGFDRRLAYTKWAQPLLDAETWIPHGINMDVFKPRERLESRRSLHPYWTEDDFVVGHVATNQIRKDWGLVAATCCELRKRVKRLRLWWHVDVDIRHWSIPALLEDYGLRDITVVTHEMNDTGMSKGYSACDVVLAPSPEGFGYPVFESLACGTPVLVGDCAGAADIMNQIGLSSHLVEPVAYRLETQHNCIRPVFSPEEWTERVLQYHLHPMYGDGDATAYYQERVTHLSWKNLWPTWRRWFKEGIQ